MNTNPDDVLLGLWLEDELEGEELAAMEARHAGNAEMLALRAEHRAWKDWLSRGIPAVEEPPYGDFFNARVLRGIGRANELKNEPEKLSRGSSWRMWFMPLAAAAGMVVAFLMGAHTQPAPQIAEIDVSNAPRAIIVEPILYTPENGVKARWFNSMEADAFVIVLDGVPAIPDSVDFTRSMSQAEGGDEESAMVEVDFPDEENEGGGS